MANGSWIVILLTIILLLTILASGDKVVILASSVLYSLSILIMVHQKYFLRKLFSK